MKLKNIWIVVFAFILNIIWEYLHAHLYISEMLVTSYNYILIRASIIDVLIICFILMFISFKNKEVKWITGPKFMDYLFIIIMGIFIAVIIELNALEKGKWMYKEAMPLIFGIGLSPLIQLAVTSILSLYLFRKLIIKKNLP